MLGFPKSTEFNKRIPKQKFYEHIEVSPALRRVFVEQIRLIYWRNKLAESTLNLAPGEAVSEVEVIEIRLQEPQLDEAVLRQIDKEIPYHILFLLEFDGKYQAWTCYKEAVTGNVAFKVNQYYHTDWMESKDLPLKMDGLNLDAVYENFVYQIAGDTLQAGDNESLQDAVQRDEKIKNLKKQIEMLQAKIRKEKQLNVQMKLNGELKKLKKELDGLV